jgi:magnesium-transporting ATPase (P-type)
MAEIKRNYQPGKRTTTTATSRTTPKTVVSRQPRQPLTSLFTNDNYKWMAIGAIVVAIGMFLMSGGKNENPAQFDPKQVYSTTRITIAPIVILLGLMIEVYAIFRKPKQAVIVEEKTI